MSRCTGDNIKTTASGTSYSYTVWDDCSTPGWTWSTPYPMPEPQVRTRTPTEEYFERLQQEALKSRLKDLEETLKHPIKGDYDIMTLYHVFMIYAEDRKNPLVHEKMVIAKDGEDAKVKSGLSQFIDSNWDSDYLTFEAVELIEVKVKPKPQEVKQV